MTLRAAYLAGVVVLIAGILAATVIAVSTVVDRAAREEVESDVLRAAEVFGVLHGYRQSQYAAEAGVVREAPRLKAVVNTDDVDPATVLDVARELHGKLDSEVFLVLDEEGFLLADVLHPGESGVDYSRNALIARALASGAASGTWVEVAEDGGHAYQVEVQRLAFGAETSGVLVVGHEFDDDLAAAVHEQTGSSVVVLLDGAIVAASPGQDGERLDREAAAEALAGVSAVTSEPVTVDVGGTTHLAVGGRFPGYAGDAALRFVVLRDLDRALAPGHRLKRIMYIASGIAIALAVAIALILSWRLSRPLDDLVAFATEVGQGNLGVRARARGVVEVKALARAMNEMVVELGESRRVIAEKERLEGELDIAQHIQTSILPRRLDVTGYEIAARMVPADEVGGDYYDVLDTGDGAWIGIGDVAGHGLPSGLIMMMAQTSVASLVEAEPGGAPAALVERLNRVLYDNVVDRMGSDRHMTLTLLRLHGDGRIVLAGAHMDVLIVRRATGEAELVRTPGTWLAIVDDVAEITEDTELAVEEGDLIVLYTDGLTEAENADGEAFGHDRLCRAVEQAASGSPSAVVVALFDALEAWMASQDDDVTAVVMRYRGRPSSADVS